MGNIVLQSSLIIQVVGKNRLALAMKFPLSLVLNVLNAFILIVLQLFKSIFNPLLLLGTLIDTPIVLSQAVWGALRAAITGKREAVTSDFTDLQMSDMDAGKVVQHKIYGGCKLLEIRILNENNVVIERKIPSYLFSPSQPISLSASTKPFIKRSDIPNLEKVSQFARWFIENDKFAKIIENTSCTIIFNEGYRPKSGKKNDPESVNPNIQTIIQWFVTKLFIDLNLLKEASKKEFHAFLDLLGESSDETLKTSCEIAMRYNIDFDSFVYERELDKIPEGTEREWFKLSLLDDSVLSAEMRILGWVYYIFFGEYYQPDEHLYAVRSRESTCDYNATKRIAWWKVFLAVGIPVLFFLVLYLMGYS